MCEIYPHLLSKKFVKIKKITPLYNRGSKYGKNPKREKPKRGKINLHYSIDKIKLEYYFVKTPRIQQFLDNLSMADFTSHRTSNKIVECKHNFEWKNESCGTVYVGIIPNWESEEKSDKNIILEYNPNKVNPFKIKELAWLQNIPVALIKVMSFDIAVDMPTPFNTVRMLKRDVREYQCQIGRSEIETRYLGVMGHNHVKLYNKAKEQKIKDMDWTRFEVTCKKINSFSSTLKEFEENIKIPSLYCVCSQIDFTEFELLNDITRLVLESIISDVNNLYTIKDYKTRKKYERLLSQFLNPIDISLKEMADTFNAFGRKFIDNNKNKDWELVDIQELMRNGKK